MKRITVLLTVLCLLLVPVSAQNVSLESAGNIKPDSEAFGVFDLYWVDNFAYDVQKSVPFVMDDGVKGLNSVREAEEKTAELEYLNEKMKDAESEEEKEEIAGLIDKVRESRNETVGDAKRFSEKVSDLAKKGSIEKLVFQAQQRHTEVLESLKDNVPESAVSGLETAIENSKGVRDSFEERYDRSIDELSDMSNKSPDDIGKKPFNIGGNDE